MQLENRKHFGYDTIRIGPDYEISGIGYMDMLSTQYHKDINFSYRVFDWGDYFTR